MKVTSRRGTFETNSSSVHAIVISKVHSHDTIPNSIIKVEGEDYGWDFEEYRNPNEKINYLWTALNDAGEDLDTWEARLRDVLELGNWVPFIRVEDGFDGYVEDAIYLDDFFDRIREDDELLKKFIYGESYVLTGNDNSDYLPLDYSDLGPLVPGLWEDDEVIVYGKWN